VSRVIGVACALVAVCAAATASADVIELTSGERVEGQLLQVIGEWVVVETGGKTVSFLRLNVRTIHLTPLPPVRANTPGVPVAEVVAALKHLQAVAAKPVEHGEYVRQLAERREVIDKYLKEPAGASPALRTAVGDALAYYEFAGSVWESRLTNSASASAAVGRSPLIDRCPRLQRIVATYPPPDNQETAWRRGVAIEFEIPTIWACASEKVTESERALPR
jgi:hypothetical protein